MKKTSCRGTNRPANEDVDIKILHCLAQLPTRTGSGVYYHNVVCQLAAQTDWQQAALFAHPNGTTADWLEADLVYPVCFDTSDLPFPIAGMSDDMPYPSTIYHKMDERQITAWKSAFNRQLIEVKATFKPDAIICHHLWMLSRLVLDVFPNTPVIGISHGTDIRQARQNPGMCEREVGNLNALKNVLALSHYHVDAIADCFGVDKDKIVVTGGAIDTDLFFPCANMKAKKANEIVRFVYAGKMSPAKGTYELIEAFCKALAIDPYISLDLIGHAPADLQRLINDRFPGSPSIRQFDVESQTHFAEHLRLSDVFLFPSYFEGLGLVALEALASGLFLVVNELEPLADQLGPSLSADPAISWVAMPALQGVDQICESAQASYIERLKGAILNQAKRRRQAVAVANQPHQRMHAFSWQSLSRRIIDLITLRQ